MKIMIHRFTGKNDRFARKIISVSLAYGVNFSPAFRLYYDLNSFKQVCVYYDDKLNRIGFKFLINSPEEDLFNIVTDGNTKTIAIKNVFDKFQLDVKDWKGWYEPKKMQESFGIIYWIYLNQKMPAPEKKKTDNPVV